MRLRFQVRKCRLVQRKSILCVSVYARIQSKTTAQRGSVRKL